MHPRAFAILLSGLGVGPVALDQFVATRAQGIAWCKTCTGGNACGDSRIARKKTRKRSKGCACDGWAP